MAAQVTIPAPVLGSDAENGLKDRRVDIPMTVQIQTISGCNANCVFCPNKKTELDIPMGKRMDWDLYRAIVDQSIDFGIRRFSPYLMNEPTMDPEMPARVKYITDRKKKFQFTKINSHGGLLSEKMAKGLLDAGLDRIYFSVQGIDPVIYEKIMALKFDRVVANIERMLELKRDGGYHTKIKVVMLETKEVAPQLPKIRKFWKDRGVKITVDQLENRGHHQHIQSDAIAPRQLQNFTWCKRMFNQIYILYDGRVVRCCADWEQTTIMGNAGQAGVSGVWYGDVFQMHRDKFLRGEVQNTICDGCTKGAPGSDEAFED